MSRKAFDAILPFSEASSIKTIRKSVYKIRSIRLKLRTSKNTTRIQERKNFKIRGCIFCYDLLATNSIILHIKRFSKNILKATLENILSYIGMLCFFSSFRLRHKWVNSTCKVWVLTNSCDDDIFYEFILKFLIRFLIQTKIFEYNIYFQQNNSWNKAAILKCWEIVGWSYRNST